MAYYGDIDLEDVIDWKFTTVDSTGAPATLTGSGSLLCYVGNSTTELTAGLGLTRGFDSRTGLNHVRVTATAANGYSLSQNYQVVVKGTVNAISISGYVVGEFSVGFRSALKPTTAKRMLTVDASGRALGDVDTIKTNPVVNGGTITFPTTATLASTTNITAGTIATVTTLTNLPAIPANWLTATGTAADFGAELADAVWDEALSGHAVSGSAGEALSNDANVYGPTILSAVQSIDTRVPAALTANGNMKADALRIGGTVQTGADVGAIKAKTDLLPGTIDGKTFIAGWTLVMSALLGKASGLATTTAIYRAVDDSKDRITATVDADGNRSAVTLDAS